MKVAAASLLHTMLVLAACTAAAADAERTLVLSGGDRLPAILRQVDRETGYVFEINGQTRNLQAVDFVSWGAPVESNLGVHVVLDRGGLIVAADVTLDGEDLLLEGTSISHAARRTAPLTVPLTLVAGILFHPTSDTDARDRYLTAISSTDSNSERLFLSNGDELSGTLIDLTPSKINFESNVGLIDMDLEKANAVAFDPALRARVAEASPGVMIGLADGSRLRAESLVTDEEVTQLTLGNGDTWQVDNASIAWLRPLRAEVTYLSNLEPASYRHLPFLDLTWPYQLDRSVTGGLLRSGGQLYLKGVGMHSTARLSWDLPQSWHRFEAEVALDDSAGKRGSVVFRVFTDGKEVYASPVVRGGEPPLPISVDLRGAKRLSLIVDFADRGDELDHADWLDARLVR